MSAPVFRFITYDTEKYPFARIFAERVIKTRDLSRFHEDCLRQKLDGGGQNCITYEDNLATRRLLKRAAQEPWFSKFYRAFVVNIIGPLFGGKLTYTWPPVFRVHMAGSPSISAPHRDTEVTGRHEMIAVWVPFVDTYGDNTLWIEKEYGSRDLAPVEVRYGQALMFDSGYLWHGSVTNTTDVTRFSMDIRVTPKEGCPEPPGLGILAARPPGYETQIAEVTPGAQYDRVQKIEWDEVT